MGLKPVSKQIQLGSIDDELRIGIWNILKVQCWSLLIRSVVYESIGNAYFVKLWDLFFKLPLEKMGTRDQNVEFVRKWYFNCRWNEVYDFVEFTIGHFFPRRFQTDRAKLVGSLNAVLRREVGGYRIVNELVTPITAAEELDAIEHALATPDNPEPCRTHIARALELLADRNTPDYRNSIKESISAVEAACCVLTRDPKATVGKALAVLQKQSGLHSALRSAFSSLYGYTSDADGIRHALLDEPNLTFDDAKFMLVACSAFVNYLVSKL